LSTGTAKPLKVDLALTGTIEGSNGGGANRGGSYVGWPTKPSPYV
jgi:hypothetical protein